MYPDQPVLYFILYVTYISIMFIVSTLNNIYKHYNNSNVLEIGINRMFCIYKSFSFLLVDLSYRLMVSFCDRSLSSICHALSINFFFI